MSEMLERLLTSDEVAELLQIPRRTLDQYAYLGTGPTFLRVGRYRRYRAPDVASWLSAHAVPPDVGRAPASAASCNPEAK